jgi:hypothetical protein
MMISKACIGGTMWLGATLGAAAQGSPNLFDSHLAERDGVLPCYGVTFTPEERDAVPGRGITRFGVRHSRDDELDGAPEVFELVFVWSLFGATTWAAVEAQCAMEDGVADCLIEGDGTNYSVAADSDTLTFTAHPLDIDIMDALTEHFGDPSQAHTITLTKGDPALCEMT